MKDQFSYVRDAPAVPGVVLRNHTLFSIFSVGFRDKCAKIETPKRSRENLDLEFMAQFPQYCYDKYKWMFPNLHHVNAATLRFDNHFEPDLDPDRAALAFALLVQLHIQLLNECDILDPGSVRINPQSAVGPNFEFTKLKNGEWLARNMRECQLVWDLAHLGDFPMYWKASGKIELLPAQKVDEGVARTFMFPDAPHRFAGQRMHQDFNERMGSIPDQWSKIGFDRSNGGFTSFGNYLTKHYDVFFMSDLSRWDARIVAFLLYISMMLRWVCYKPKYRTHDNWKRLVYQYKNKIKTLMVLPTGQIVFIDHGNKSGQDSTSYDNTTAHEYIYLYEFIGVMQSMGLEPTLSNIRRHLGLGLYGDDSLGGVTNACYATITESQTFEEFLDGMYSRWGMILKKGSVKVQRTVVGLQFIGGIFKDTPYGLAHTFSIDRIMCAMVKSVGAYDREMLWSKYIALLTLSAFEECRHSIRTWMRRTLVNWGETRWIPNDLDLYSFWFGWETHAGPLSLDGAMFLLK